MYQGKNTTRLGHSMKEHSNGFQISSASPTHSRPVNVDREQSDKLVGIKWELPLMNGKETKKMLNSAVKNHMQDP